MFTEGSFASYEKLNLLKEFCFIENRLDFIFLFSPPFLEPFLLYFNDLKQVLFV